MTNSKGHYEGQLFREVTRLGVPRSNIFHEVEEAHDSHLVLRQVLSEGLMGERVVHFYEDYEDGAGPYRPADEQQIVSHIDHINGLIHSRRQEIKSLETEREKFKAAVKLLNETHQ